MFMYCCQCLCAIIKKKCAAHNVKYAAVQLMFMNCCQYLCVAVNVVYAAVNVYELFAVS